MGLLEIFTLALSVQPSDSDAGRVWIKVILQDYETVASGLQALPEYVYFLCDWLYGF